MAKNKSSKKSADDPIEREIQARAREAEGSADLVTAKARGQEIANKRAKAGSPHADAEAHAKIGLINAQADAHRATAAHRHAAADHEQARARAVDSKRVNDREAHQAHVERIASEQADAHEKAMGTAAHSYARASFEEARAEHERARVNVAHAQARKVAADTAAVRHRTASAAKAEPFKRESEERARTVWAQQDEDRARRSRYFEEHMRRENVHHTIAAVRGVLGAFGGGNGELRSGLRGQMRGGE